MNTKILNHIRQGQFAPALMECEKEIYKLAMEKAQYNQSKAAVYLEISRTTLRNKLQKYFPGRYIDK